MTLDTDTTAPAPAPASMDAQLESISSKLDDLPKAEQTAEQKDKAEYDMLAKAFDKASAKPAPGEPEPEGEETTEAAPERGPDGKFKSKLPEGAKAEAADESEETETDEDSPKTKAVAPETKEAKPVVEAPKHWPEKVKSEFAKLDPEAQRELAKESTEAKQMISRLGRELSQAQPVMKVLNQAKALFDREGVSFDQGVAALLRAQAQLSNPDTAKDALMRLASQYNIDLSDSVAEAEDQDWVDPNVARLEGHVRMLTDRLAQYERHTVEQTQAHQQQTAVAMVNQFFADKGDVSDELATEVANRARMYTLANPDMPFMERLAKAWDETQALSPATRERMIQEELERKAKAAQKARKAASLNVTSSDKPGGMSEYDRLAAAYDKAMSA